jgi:hypothetical protein
MEPGLHGERQRRDIEALVVAVEAEDIASAVNARENSPNP